MKNESMEINMNLLKTVLTTASVLLISLSASASIESDITDGKSMQVIFKNADTENIILENVFARIAAKNENLVPSATKYATCLKLDSNEAILNYAFQIVSTFPLLAKPSADAARECKVPEEDILGSALANNVDPTTIGEATAAGAGTGAPIAATSFGSAGGSVGGGTASAG
jgi:hypothetical protein